MTHRSDDRLMADYVRGDENALRILVERWERIVFVFLVRMVGSPEEAEDLCQDTFMKLIKAAGRYEPGGRFRSWLFRIAGNLARSRLRRRRILRWLPLADASCDVPSERPDPFESLADRESTELVRNALSRLPGRQRQALVLKQYHDLSYREIADAMGVSVSSVQMLLHRAMTALRKDLANRKDER